MYQLSNIYSLGMNLDRKGTMAIWNSPEATQWQDYLITAQLRMIDDDGIGIQFRHLDELNFYRLDIDHLRNFRRLIRVLNGDATMLAGAYGTPPLGEAFELAIQVVDSQITVLIDDNLAFAEQIDDKEIDQGTIGLYSFANTGAEFLNLVVQTPSTKGHFGPTTGLDLQTLPNPADPTSIPQAPELKILRTPSNIELRWQDPNQQWQLQLTEQIGNDPDWKNIDRKPISQGTDRVLNISMTEQMTFYRLAPEAKGSN